MTSTLSWPEIKQIQSTDQNVSKLVFTKPDAVAEAVLYKYPTYGERTVICCSTMSGCPVGCRFCGAGDGFVRCLTADEIVEQSVYLLETLVDCKAADMKRLQIMFMSMGEPVMNADALIEACRRLYAAYPNAALLISTSAPVMPMAFKKIRQASIEIPKIGLQFSVHESTDAARRRLIPTPTMRLVEIAEEGEAWAKATGRRPFFNYCVHDGNNTLDDVTRLVNFFDPKIWEATISVICERDEHVAAANKRQEQLALDFMNKLMSFGYSTRCFNPAGQDDIGGGCGQLWFVQDWMAKNKDKVRDSRGKGLPKVHTPREEPVAV